MDSTVLISNVKEEEQLCDIANHFAWIKASFGTRSIREQSCTVIMFNRLLTEEETKDIIENSHIYEVDDMFLIIPEDLKSVDNETYKLTNAD